MIPQVGELDELETFIGQKKTEVAYQTKEVIAHQFGEQTLKLHYALDAIAFRQPEAWKEEIKVSVSKLLADL